MDFIGVQGILPPQPATFSGRNISSESFCQLENAPNTAPVSVSGIQVLRAGAAGVAVAASLARWGLSHAQAVRSRHHWPRTPNHHACCLLASRDRDVPGLCSGDYDIDAAPRYSRQQPPDSARNIRSDTRPPDAHGTGSFAGCGW